MEEVREWISVEDRLPEDDSYVHIYHPNYGVYIGFYSGISEHWKDMFHRYIEVVCWFPFPNPPEAKK